MRLRRAGRAGGEQDRRGVRIGDGGPNVDARRRLAQRRLDPPIDAERRSIVAGVRVEETNAIWEIGTQTIERTPEARRRLYFFNDTATTEIYTLSLHDALPI